VSKHISQLEDDLGYPLFIRSKRSVKLTPAGERSRRFFQEELARVTEFVAGERETQERLNKSLRIGYNNWLNLGKAIGSARVRFHALYPDVAHVPERQPPDLLQQKLRTGELDIILVLRRFLRSEAGLRIIGLADFPMSIIVKKSSIASEEDKGIEHLSTLPLIINSFSDETSAETIARAKHEMARFGLSNKKIQLTPNRDSVYTAVQTGEGIATACSFSYIPEDILSIPTDETDTLVCACLETNKRKLIRKYMEFLRDEFAKPENRI